MVNGLESTNDSWSVGLDIRGGGAHLPFPHIVHFILGGCHLFTGNGIDAPALVLGDVGIVDIKLCLEFIQLLFQRRRFSTYIKYGLVSIPFPPSRSSSYLVKSLRSSRISWEREGANAVSVSLGCCCLDAFRRFRGLLLRRRLG